MAAHARRGHGTARARRARPGPNEQGAAHPADRRRRRRRNGDDRHPFGHLCRRRGGLRLHPDAGPRRLRGGRGPRQPGEPLLPRAAQRHGPGRPRPADLRRAGPRRLRARFRRHRERARAAHGAGRRGLGRGQLLGIRRLLRRARRRPLRAQAPDRGTRHASDARHAARRRRPRGRPDPGPGRRPEKRVRRRHADSERRRQPQHRGRVDRGTARHARPGPAGGRAGRRHASSVLVGNRQRLAREPHRPDRQGLRPRHAAVSAARVDQRERRHARRYRRIQDRGTAHRRHVLDGGRANASTTRRTARRSSPGGFRSRARRRTRSGSPAPTPTTPPSASTTTCIGWGSTRSPRSARATPTRP